MNIYDVEETTVGNYFKINYLLARQLMIVFDTYKQRILDATVSDIGDTIQEFAHHYENKVSYSYEELPRGWSYIIEVNPKVDTIYEFVNWFFKHKQQVGEYLIYGVLRGRDEKRKNVKEDKTATVSIYGGTPLVIEDKKGKMISSTFRKF